MTKEVILFILVTSSLIKLIKEMKVQNREISDHNPIVLELREPYKKFNWKLNEDLLKNEEIINKGRESIKWFFKENMKINNEIPLATIWDAGKAVIRGFFIQQNIIYQKYKKQKVRLINEALKEKENDLKRDPQSKKTQKELKVLQKQLELEAVAEIDKKLKSVKQILNRQIEQENG